MQANNESCGVIVAWPLRALQKCACMAGMCVRNRDVYSDAQGLRCDAACKLCITTTPYCCTSSLLAMYARKFCEGISHTWGDLAEAHNVTSYPQQAIESSRTHALSCYVCIKQVSCSVSACCYTVRRQAALSCSHTH